MAQVTGHGSGTKRSVYQEPSMQYPNRGGTLRRKKKSEPKRIYRLIPPVAYSIGLLCLLVTISSGIIGGGVLS